MTKSKFKITKKDAFGVGRIEGSKEAFQEILQLINGFNEGLVPRSTIETYIRSKLRALTITRLDDALKQKDIK